MWQRSPFTGVGLDAYGAYWRRDRPLASPRRLGGAAYSDSAHSVPIQHLAQGGLLLALAYLFFCSVIIVALVRGLRRLEGQDRLLLAGLGGTWTAYQVQSLVSIDQVPLLILNFVVGAGVLVAAGTVTRREVRLPGAPAPETPGRGRKIKKPLRRPTTPVDVALYTGIGAVVVVLLWLVFVPLRANHAVYAAAVDSANGDSASAVGELEHAVDLEPAVGNYRTKLGEELGRAGRNPDAQRAYAGAFDVDVTEVNAGLFAADLAVEAGDIEEARRLFDRALVMDPSNGATILRWASFTREHGDAKAAQTRLERATRDLPGEVLLWAALGDVRLAAGDKAGARSAYEQALVVDPTHQPAKDALQTLDAEGG
jgi:tetratricopeptide (TPR) repeat protein